MVKLFCQTFSKTAPAPSEKSLHRMSKSRNCFQRSRSPAKHTLDILGGHWSSIHRGIWHLHIVQNSIENARILRSDATSTVQNSLLIRRTKRPPPPSRTPSRASLTTRAPLLLALSISPRRTAPTPPHCTRARLVLPPMRRPRRARRAAATGSPHRDAEKLGSVPHTRAQRARDSATPPRRSCSPPAARRSYSPPAARSSGEKDPSTLSGVQGRGAASRTRARRSRISETLAMASGEGGDPSEPIPEKMNKAPKPLSE